MSQFYENKDKVLLTDPNVGFKARMIPSSDFSVRVIGNRLEIISTGLVTHYEPKTIEEFKAMLEHTCTQCQAALKSIKGDA